MVNQSGLHEKIREASQLEPDLEVLAILFSPLPIPPPLSLLVPYRTCATCCSDLPNRLVWQYL